MDLQTIFDVFFGLMMVLCAALVVYGGWLSLGEAVRSDKNNRRSGPQTTAPTREPRAEAFPAAVGPVVPEPAFTFKLRGSATTLYSCLAIVGISYLLFACTDVDSAGSPVWSAATTEGVRQTRASSDYFPANYVNQGRDGDGNAMTYEHD